jgi:hypothetical protein
MDITGARWGLAGAQAILTLRALISNGDFDEYWTFHLTQEHPRVHASRYALGVIPRTSISPSNGPAPIGFWAPLSDHRRRYCDEHRRERFRTQAPAGRERAAEVLAQLRAGRRDPAHGVRPHSYADGKNATHQATVRSWEGDPPGPEIFRSEILPGLRHVRIGVLVAATGPTPGTRAMAPNAAGGEFSYRAGSGCSSAPISSHCSREGSQSQSRPRFSLPRKRERPRPPVRNCLLMLIDRGVAEYQRCRRSAASSCR